MTKINDVFFYKYAQLSTDERSCTSITDQFAISRPIRPSNRSDRDQPHHTILKPIRSWSQTSHNPQTDQIAITNLTQSSNRSDRNHPPHTILKRHLRARSSGRLITDRDLMWIDFWAAHLRLWWGHVSM